MTSIQGRLFTIAALGAAVFALEPPALAQPPYGNGANIAEYMAGVAATPVPLADVPAVVRDSAQKALGTSNLTDVTEQMHHSGDHVYQFNARDAAGAPHSAIVADDGHVLHQR